MGINTNQLKKFAQNTRRKLIQQVGAKVDHILSTDSAELRDVSDSVKRLRKDIDRSTREDVIEQVAYTWFNRLTALRYMDLHDYQPLGLRIISPRDTGGEIELYQAALQSQLPDELEVDHQQISQLLTGQITSRNPHTEVMRILLVATCQNLHQVMPFLFDRINSYAELLLPDDLLSDQSVLADFRRGMTAENSVEVEVIGWLYQFYISEKKDAVFASKGKVKKEEIPAATQLFTPRWIVEYMVQNTVGKLWLLNNPNSHLRDYMPYYIESSVSTEDVLTINNPEELTLLDQACGSGHILVYGFDLLYKIYEEAGYPPSEIPELIIRHNLHGFEIDPRAAQLATLAISLKAREYHRRFFRKLDIPAPSITCFEDFRLSEEEVHEVAQAFGLKPSESLLQDLEHMRQATQFGSLIRVSAPMHELRECTDLCNQNLQTTDIYLQNQITQLDLALTTLIALARTHACIVDNPPYMGSGKMNNELSDFVKHEFPDSKADLLACFMERALFQLRQNGLLSMINLPSWMFLSSFESFRRMILKEYQIETLLHLGRGVFGSDFGTVAFTFRKTDKEKNVGIYRRLFDKHVQVRSIDKIEKLFLDKEYGYFNANQKDFEKIPGSPVGYWVSTGIINSFKNNTPLENFSIPKFGMSSGDGQRFIRYTFEVKQNSIFKNAYNLEDFGKGKIWGLLDKGGEYRKWYGNQYHVINWSKNGYEIKNHSKSAVRSPQYFLQPHHSWTLVSSGAFSARFFPQGFLLDTASNCVYLKSNSYKFTILSFLNTKLTYKFLKILNPTLNYSCGVVGLLPFASIQTEAIDNLAKDAILIAKKDWNSRETSWDFKLNELLVIGGREMVDGGWSMVGGQLVDIGRLMVDGESLDGEMVDGQSPLTLEKIYENYKIYWSGKFYQLHAIEEELNRLFIGIYGLEDELTPEVPLDEITILQEELDRKKLKALDKQWIKVGRTVDNRPELPFKDQEVMAQLLSYAVGCMFGRYSLDKEGLILANQGETISDYVRKVDGGRLMVDGESVVDGGWEMVDGERVVDSGWEMVDGKSVVDGGWEMVDGERVVDSGWEMVDGKSVVDGGWEMVDGGSESGGESGSEKNQEYDTGLQRTEGMAAEPKSGQIGLFDDGPDATGRTLQPDGSDQKGGGEHSKQYSRGPVKGQEGISPLPSDSPGFAVGTGDSTPADRGSGDAPGSQDRTTSEGDHKHQKTNPQSDGQTPITHTSHPTPQPPSTNNQPPSTNSHPPSTNNHPPSTNNHPPSTNNHPPSTNNHQLKFMPDNDAIIPVMAEKWFDDDIVSRMEEFLKVAFGIEYFRENMNFLTEKLGSGLRRYFVREFYKDHISRYKKRPIYWMLSSPEGHFRVLIYMHRYTADTLSIVLNKYLNPLIEKLETQKLHQRHLADTGNDRERRQAEKEIQRLDRMILDCKAYRQDTLYPLALKRIEIDLDDGVLVNYNKFGKVVAEVKGLNDKKAKIKVRKFDWIDTSDII